MQYHYYILGNNYVVQTDNIEIVLARFLNGRVPVILCIGSDKVVGDSLGPLVGHMLKNIYNVPCFVYGCLQCPVNALNLTETVLHISKKHSDLPILAVDSSIGANVGHINVFNGALCPGAADNKPLPKVGDISITATVTNLSPIKSLTQVSLGAVYTMATTIASGINNAITASRHCLPTSSIAIAC